MKIADFKKIGATISNITNDIKLPELKFNNKAEKESQSSQKENITQPTEKKIVISSLDDMSLWLENLSQDSPITVKSALESQLEIIRYIKSPTLIDTTFDTLILNLKKSLSLTDSEDMKNEIRERFTLMMQNYIFFLDARLQTSLSSKNKESKALLNTAGEMLCKSVISTATLAIPGGQLASIASGIIIKNVFSSDSKDFTQFFNIFKLFQNKQEEIETKKNEFYTTIKNIILKFDKYHELIGPSILINGIIERYAEPVSDYAFNSSINNINTEISNTQKEIASLNLIQFNKKKQLKEQLDILNSRLNDERSKKEQFYKSLIQIADKFN